jgi:hypothetical protein
VGIADKEKACEQINTQYWAACFMNGLEAYANVRRSGYPKLTPINYPSNETDGLTPQTALPRGRACPECRQLQCRRGAPGHRQFQNKGLVG